MEEQEPTPEEIHQAKIDTLKDRLEEQGISYQRQLGRTELTRFLNNRCKDGQFYPQLSDKLFEIIKVDDNRPIRRDDFVEEYVKFDDAIKANADEFIKKRDDSEKDYKNSEEAIKNYKTTLNREGLCKDAKVTVKITDVNYPEKLEGINSIIIKVNYNNEKKSVEVKEGVKPSELNSIVFTPKSRKDRMEFIMQTLNARNQLIDIGKKEFKLNTINSQEEYSAQISIPEIDDEEKIVGYINARIILYWSDLKYYEMARNKNLKKYEKVSDATGKAVMYAKKVKEVYGELRRKKPDLLVNFNNEKNVEQEFDVNFNNQREYEAPEFDVQFNNEVIHETNFDVDFNDQMLVEIPVTGYEYQEQEKYPRDSRY